MDRRKWFCLLLVSAGCSSQPGAPVFPASVSGWNLKATQQVPAGSAPDLVRRIGTRGCWSAVYEGPGSATVDLYALTAPAAGLEMTQQWRPTADTVVWYTPHHFIVVRWQSGDRASVSALIRGLQKQFGEQQ